MSNDYNLWFTKNEKKLKIITTSYTQEPILVGFGSIYSCYMAQGQWIQINISVAHLLQKTIVKNYMSYTWHYLHISGIYSRIFWIEK